jgi:drug/metabolite transporter (DMT)-like permease
MNQSRHQSPDKVAIGVIVIVATVFTMALGDGLVKRISADFTLWQIYVLRSLVAIPITAAAFVLGRKRVAIRPRSIGWVFLRSMLLMIMWIAFYAALQVQSQPIVGAAYYTGPLFITLLSAFIFGEPVGMRRWMAVLIGFLGVLVILRPGTSSFSYVTLLPIVSALFYALAAILTRTKCREESPLVLTLGLNFSFLAVGIIGTAAIAVWNPTASQAATSPFLLGHWVAMGGRGWGIIAFLAALIVVVSSGVAKAYQSGPPAIIATFDYAYLVFAVFWSFVFFSDLPNVTTILGMFLIAGAGILALLGPPNAGLAPAATQTLGATNR